MNSYEHPRIRFDSILVRLKASGLLSMLYAFTRFDSILVRLKVYYAYVDRTNQILFRFHTGSIKSEIYHDSGTRGVSFDSILVRLKGKYQPHLDTRITVSIPYWFD